MSPALPIEQYRGPLAVTLAYLATYYAFALNVLLVKNSARRQSEERGETFDRYVSKNRRLLTADRYMLNTLEHMPPFLTLLWLAAIFRGGSGVTLAGAVYVITRVLYPFLMGSEVGTNLPRRLLAATYTGYAVLGYLALAVALAWCGA